jgi:hypothetical protein
MPIFFFLSLACRCLQYTSLIQTFSPYTGAYNMKGTLFYCFFFWVFITKQERMLTSYIGEPPIYTLKSTMERK